MFISAALAHGTTGDETIGGFGPLFLLGVAAVFVLALVAESRWRKHRRLKREAGENITAAPD